MAKVNPIVRKLSSLKSDQILSVAMGDYKRFKKASIDYAKLAVKNFELLPETTSQSIKVPLFSKLGLRMAKVWFLNKFRVKTPEERTLKKLIKEYKNKQKISQMINKV